MTTATWTEFDTYIQRNYKFPADCRVIGYARVSTDDQELNLQIAALKDAGCDRIYLEKQSTRKTRPVFENLKDICREGVKLIVWRLDRLGRDIADMATTVQHFCKNGVQLVSLKERLDLDSAAGMLMLHIMFAFAQYERDLTRERTIAGMAEAKRQGKKFGQPSEIHGEKRIRMMIDIWNPILTNRQITERAGYKSTATLFNHFAGERGKVKQARKQGKIEFKKLRMKALEECAKAEGVSIRRLNQIIKETESLE